MRIEGDLSLSMAVGVSGRYGVDMDIAHHSTNPESALANSLIPRAYAFALSPECFIFRICPYSIAAGHGLGSYVPLVPSLLRVTFEAFVAWVSELYVLVAPELLVRATPFGDIAGTGPGEVD